MNFFRVPVAGRVHQCGLVSWPRVIKVATGVPETFCARRMPGAWTRLQRIAYLVRQEEGSVEAGLTLIPLTILFLISAQLVFASHWGNAQLVDQQSRTNRVAITGESNIGAGANIKYEPLLGGGHLVVSERSRRIPWLANLPGVNSQEFLFRKRTVSLSEVFTR